MVEVTELGDLCDFIRGVTFDKAEATDYPRKGALPVLRAGNIGRELNTQTDLVWVSEKRISAEQKLRKNDVTICMSSGSPEVVGKTARVRQDFNGSIGSFCGIIRPKLAGEAAMVAYFFQSEMFRKYRDDIARGANIQNLRFSQFEEIQVPRPEDPQRLASLLDKADHLRRTRRYAQNLSDTFLQSVFLEMFGDPATNPKGWDVSLLADIAGTASGGTPSRGNAAYYGGTIPWIKSGELHQGVVMHTEETLTEAGLKNSSAKLQPAGTVLLAMYGATAGVVAKLGIRATTNQAVCSITPGSSVDAEFLATLLRTLTEHILRQTVGGAQPNLSQQIVNDLRLILPPLPLQEQFAQVVRRTERLRGQQREAARQAEHLFQALLAQAFRGEV